MYSIDKEGRKIIYKKIIGRQKETIKQISNSITRCKKTRRMNYLLCKKVISQDTGVLLASILTVRFFHKYIVYTSVFVYLSLVFERLDST